MAKRKGRSRKGSYKLTAKRRVALKKAQAVSARKRKAAPNKVVNGSGRKFNSAAMGGRKRKSRLQRNVGIGAAVVGVGAITAGGVVARHKLSGSSFERINHPIASGTMGNISGSRAASLSSRAFTTNAGKIVEKKYIQKNLMTKETKEVTRHVKGGTRILGRDFTFNSKKQGPLGDSYSITYKHRKLKVGIKDILGTKLHNKILASQHYGNPFSPKYKQDSKGNYGSHGPRMKYEGPRKYIGGTEIFSEKGVKGKRSRTGFTTIGSAMSGKKG